VTRRRDPSRVTLGAPEVERRERESESRPNMERVVKLWVQQFYHFISPEAAPFDEAGFFERHELKHHNGWTYTMYLLGITAYPDDPDAGEDRSAANVTVVEFVGNWRGTEAHVTWSMHHTPDDPMRRDLRRQVSDTYDQYVRWQTEDTRVGPPEDPLRYLSDIRRVHHEPGWTRMIPAKTE
jgi:hypothetical protein